MFTIYYLVYKISKIKPFKVLVTSDQQSKTQIFSNQMIIQDKDEQSILTIEKLEQEYVWYLSYKMSKTVNIKVFAVCFLLIDLAINKIIISSFLI